MALKQYIKKLWNDHVHDWEIVGKKIISANSFGALEGTSYGIVAQCKKCGKVILLKS